MANPVRTVRPYRLLGAALAVLFSAFFITACAVSGQGVVITPKLMNDARDIGRERPVHLSVVDARPSALLGYRRTETGDRARVESTGDPVAAVQSAIEVALEDKGFSLAPYGRDAEVSLTVQIQEIAYDASGKYVAPSVTTGAVFKAIARRGGTTFEQLYRIEKQSREALPLTSDRNSRLINETVSEALTMLADDMELMGFLAGGPAPRR